MAQAEGWGAIVHVPDIDVGRLGIGSGRRQCGRQRGVSELGTSRARAQHERVGRAGQPFDEHIAITGAIRGALGRIDPRRTGDG